VVATTGLRRFVRNALLRLPPGVRGALEIRLLRSYEAYLRLRAPRTQAVGVPDALPLPPAKLRVLVSGTADAQFFLTSGREQATHFRSMLSRHDVSVSGMAILDFGCGCGRITRWWDGVEGPVKIFACDPHPELAGWCRANLAFADVAVSGENPPLPYPDAAFDFVYALSIFTHLPEDRCVSWMAELHRVIRPGGLLLFTIAGDSYRERLGETDQHAYDAGRPVVQFDTAAGTNLCIAYHPPAYVRGPMTEGFDLLEAYIADEHPQEARQAQMIQDSYLVRRAA
jgi:SAM-dependent methyltransferase